MREFKLLKFLDIFKGIFISLGVDYKVMRLILQVKLTMDTRRPTTIINNNAKQKEDKNNFNMSLLMYAFYGLMFGMVALLPMPIFYTMTTIFTVILLFTTLIMISDFSAVLLDIRDRGIISSRPVSNKTLNMAKTIHIASYMLSIVFALSLVSIIITSVRFGIVFALIFIFELGYMSLFIIFLTSILYYVILSLYDGEKLKDIINYFQIVFTMLIFIAQQFTSRIFSLAGNKVSYTPKWWHYFLPSMWMASPLTILKEGAKYNSYIYLMICLLLIPFVLFLLYVKLIAPSFEHKLQKMSSSYGSRRKGRIKNWWEEKKVQLLCRSNIEKAFFRFITNMLSSERKLKLQIYPLMMMSIIFPLIMLISFSSMGGSLIDTISNLRSSKVYFFMYLSALFNVNYVSIITRSESYKAAWIYRAAPINRPSDIYRAGVKTVIAKYSIPVLLLQSVVFIAFCGISILPNIIVIFINMFLITLITLNINKKELPFSKEMLTANQGQTGKGFLTLVIVAAIGLAHFGISHFTYGTLILGILCLFSSIFLWKYTFNFGWSGVEL
ncbi:hypothetical protein [Candidatus Clostridium radicumherbarum]|uniref:ABC transporter permease n=1 Tax=Candidatus Clostridium radicumherbarum TaxID=3381662 RepID=A0ABW8TRC8_9CLOT